MKRALELAERGLGTVSPNPLVGCLLVAEEQIIGEGWHQRYGELHAEINALETVEKRSLLPKATAYVTLEPCAHFGKTPPCADRLIKEKIPHVVVGMQDPFGKVDGQGIAKMRAAGIKVEVGVLEDECRQLNKRFLTFHEQKRPWVMLKWAQTADGFVAREDFSSKWISDAFSRKLVHKWRSEEDAILVGTNTLRYDDPSLTVRDWVGRSPIRVTLDRDLRLFPDRTLFDQRHRTLCFNAIRSEMVSDTLELIKIDFGKPLISQLLCSLYQKDVQSLLVEGGTRTLQGFLDACFWDEIRIFVAPHSFGAGIPAPQPQGIQQKRQQLQQDTLLVYRNTKWL